MTDTTTDYLSREEELTLLRIARDSLEHHVRTGQRIEVETYPLTANLRARHGAFVTLREAGALRGCIGYTKSLEALALAVRDNAINAAVRDPRFEPVRKEELPNIHIEVSALCPGDEPESPFIAVSDISDIMLGRDGLYLECGGSRGGLLLPQVPIEQGWTVEQFLSGLCRKAGVPDGSWDQPGYRLHRFSAQVFGEA